MAVMYVDMESGTNTFNLTALTGVTVANASGVARCTKTAHGLVNGQLVRLSSFDAWLNRVWEITNVQPNTFDLVDSVWQTTALNSGSVTPYNGYSWASAIKQPGAIYNAFSNIKKPNIEARVAKTSSPTSIGNATWTNGSGTVTLATAQTTTIDNCETAWTATNGSSITAVTTSPVKQGTNRIQVTMPASGITTNTKYGYKTLPSTLNLSAYQQISYWLQPSSTTAIDADTEYKICLCSDTTGDTVVDEFLLPRQNLTGSETISFVVTKNGGGNLGSSIQSIAIYTSTTTPTASTSIRLDNIIATKTNGLNLRSVISKCNSATYDHTQDPWFPIDYIDGTDVQLGIARNLNWNSTGSTYYKYFTEGTSPETVTSYQVNPIDFNVNVYTFSSLTTAFQNPAKYPFTDFTSNNQYGKVTISGGYNKSNDTVDGMTWLDGFYNFPGVISTPSITSGSLYGNTAVKNFGFVNFRDGINCSSSWVYDMGLENIHFVRENGQGFIVGSSTWFDVGDISIYNCTYNNTWSSAQSITYSSVGGRLENLKAINIFPTIKNIQILNGVLKNILMTQPDYTGASGHTFKGVYNTETSNIRLVSTVVPANSTGNYGIRIAPGVVPTVINGLSIKGCYAAIKVDTGQFTRQGDIILNNPTFTGNTYTYTYSSGSTGSIISNNPTSTDTNLVLLQTSLQMAYQGISIINNAVGGNKNTINHYYKDFGTEITATTAFSATVTAQTAVRHTASGIAWQINPLVTRYSEIYPFKFKIASVAVNAGSQVTVKAWVKLSHATDIGAKLLIQNGQISGPTNEVTATKSSDTNWEELTVTFTPSIQGVVDIHLEAYWKANLADESVYVDDIQVSQA